MKGAVQHPALQHHCGTPNDFVTCRAVILCFHLFSSLMSLRIKYIFWILLLVEQL